MASVEQQLWSLVSEIEPTPTQKAGAARSQNHLRDLLSTGQIGARIRQSYLSGSYSRDTAIRPLDDVDVIFVIDPNGWSQGLAGLFRPAPEVVLNTFANAIRYRYPVSSTFGQRRSVRLELYHLDIDCVPAIEEAPGSDFVLIPDRDSGEWIRSSPRRHAAQATAVNQQNGGRAKPLVKLLKYWNGNLPSTARVRSFLIETLALTLLRQEPAGSLEGGLLSFFSFLSGFGGQSLLLSWTTRHGVTVTGYGGMTAPDLAGTGTNVAGRIDTATITKLVQHAARSRDRMLEAQRARSVDTAVDRVARALRGDL
ncbi:SMODS domain-containing nucleotidyltransferase [Roseateles saccharophilus]|uniref:Nucleotidyltransferase-like protein n=1 Tax=Roseateles saccharophilus TaxID=304 RepID=A0A4R3UBW5_ROSSA|nr:nucleotidyltransferase [Roseateles saccharophilus]MDG0835749.1 nucleotidyltransferase [Roseateles saccharophilus]TCU84667.1 hypothetical protein EV671_105220 [Roseateles saccharophilus]